MNAVLRALVVLATLAGGAIDGKIPPAQGRTPAAPIQSFSWFAELVALDRPARLVTVRAAIEPHVAKYVDRFKGGEPIVLVWQQFDGEADAIRYIASSGAMAADAGFIIRASYVSADRGARTVTFVTQVSDTVVRTLGSAPPGTPIKFRSIETLDGSRPATTAATLNERAGPRPAPKPTVTAHDVAGSPTVAGRWRLETSVMNNPLKLTCDVTQDGKKLGGTCGGPGPLGEVVIAGSVDGAAVTFQFEVTSFGPRLVFLHRGELGADGAIKGTLNMMGSDSPFTMTKALY